MDAALIEKKLAFIQTCVPPDVFDVLDLLKKSQIGTSMRHADWRIASSSDNGLPRTMFSLSEP